MDASIHDSLNKRSQILILDCPLVLIESSVLVAVDLGDILEVALTALVADRTVKGVVSKQEFHDSASSHLGDLTLGVDLHVGHD